MTTVMTTFSFLYLFSSIDLTSPEDISFLTAFLLYNKLIIECHFSDKITPDSQEILYNMVLQCTCLSYVELFLFFFFAAVSDRNLQFNLLSAVMSFNIAISPFFKY